MAQHVDIIMSRLSSFIDNQINLLAQNNPLIAFTKPIITRIINNNAYKFETVLKQISDKDGLIDINGILTEMIDNIIHTRPFKIDTKYLGELETGGGRIKINLPLVDRALVLNHQDLVNLRDMLDKQITQNLEN